jgi:hypothetical protein
VPAIAVGEFGEFFHLVADFLTRQAQLVELLQVKPKLRADAKPMDG